MNRLNNLPEDLQNKIWEYLHKDKYDEVLSNFGEKYKLDNLYVHEYYRYIKKDRTIIKGSQLYQQLKHTINLSKRGRKKISLMRVNKDYKDFIDWNTRGHFY